MIEPITAESMERDYVYALYKSGLLIPGVKTENSAHDMAVNFANQRNIRVAEFFGSTRVARIAHARQECMALIREKTDLSLPQIGRIFNRDHSTVLHALRAVERRAA